MRRLFRASLLGLGLAGSLSAALAQSNPVPATPGPAASKAAGKPVKKKTAAAKPASHKPDPYQSPLATIMQSHLRADVPEAQDFVRESRPAARDLKYTPLQSQLPADPVRPKPRDPANVMALQAEMEASLAQNSARGGQGKPRHAKSRAAAKAGAAD